VICYRYSSCRSICQCKTLLKLSFDKQSRYRTSNQFPMLISYSVSTSQLFGFVCNDGTGSYQSCLFYMPRPVREYISWGKFHRAILKLRSAIKSKIVLRFIRPITSSLYVHILPSYRHIHLIFKSVCWHILRYFCETQLGKSMLSV
jgi:hypothetical protein